MQKRNATVAVIGAGDYIGAEIVKKFASEGFTVFAGRRNGEKLEPLVKEVEAAGGTIFGRSLDARKEEETTAFLNDADKHAPIELCLKALFVEVAFHDSRNTRGRPVEQAYLKQSVLDSELIKTAP